MSYLSRREFIKKSMLVAAVIGIPVSIIPKRYFDPVNTTVKDIDAIEEYSEHFTVPIPDSFKQLCSDIRATGYLTPETQFKLKTECCRWMLKSGHETFKDTLWDVPKQAAKAFLKKEKT